MRLVQIIIPEGKKDTITDLLREKGVEYVVSPETSSREYSDVLFFPIPKEGVEEILDELRNAGLEKDGYTVICKAEAVVAKRFEELKERYETSEEVDESRVARQELRASASEILPSTRVYLILTIAASIIASAGILLDSAAIVVGSMVIAPLIGPAMASCVGTVIDDKELFRGGINKQVLGLTVAIISSAAFARLAISVFVSPNLDLLALGQIGARLNPGFLSLAVALGSGLAGALSMTSGISSALVGVMISVALLPPAATMGIGIAILNLQIVAGAGILVLVNVLSINLAGTFTLWIEGYKPGSWFEEQGAKRVTKRRTIILTISLLVIAVFLGLLTWNIHDTAQTETIAKQTVRQTVNKEGGEIITISSGYTGIIFREIKFIKATVSLPQTENNLAKKIGELITEKTGKNLVIQLSVVETQTSNQ